MANGKRWARFLAPLAWYGVIFFLSAQPGDASQEISDGVLTHLFGIDLERLANMDWDLMLLASFLVRKAAHMGAFFALTGLLCWALKPWWEGKRAWPWLGWGLCVLLAVSDEVHQYFVPGRSCMLRDVLLDAAGGLLCLLCWHLWRKIRQRRRTQDRAKA